MKLLKPGKELVIELEDGIDYLAREDAEAAIRRGDTHIPLIRLYDFKPFLVPISKMAEALKNKDNIDYLDKRPQTPN